MSEISHAHISAPTNLFTYTYAYTKGIAQSGILDLRGWGKFHLPEYGFAPQPIYVL